MKISFSNKWCFYMKIIDEEFVRKIDDKLIGDGVLLHARILRVAVEWMKENKIKGNPLDDNIITSIELIYKSLYPSGNFSFPPLISAGVAVRDRMYPVNINLVYGIYAIDPLKSIDISEKELNYVYHHHLEQFNKAFFGACDLWDFAYSIQEILTIGTNKEAEACFQNAHEQLSATSSILIHNPNNTSSIQSAYLAAELSLKGALFYFNQKKEDFKKKIRNSGHNLVDAANYLISIKPTKYDELLIETCEKFPNYVQSRYSSNDLSCIELMNLAMKSIFVAAESVRRITDRYIVGDEYLLRPKL